MYPERTSVHSAVTNIYSTSTTRHSQHPTLLHRDKIGWPPPHNPCSRGLVRRSQGLWDQTTHSYHRHRTSNIISLVRFRNSLGQDRAEGKGELATFRHRADSGREERINVRRHDLVRLNASMIKQKQNQE